MSLRKLYDLFRGRTDLPIEITELRDAVVKFGPQDGIIFQGRDLDPGELGGIFYQWKDHPAPYAEPRLMTLIVFPSNALVSSQRMVCAKELVHIMDPPIERVNDADKLKSLAEKLLGPMSSEDFGLADLIAAQDKMAVYRCIPLVFPSAARIEAIAAAEAGSTIEKIAEVACLPARIVELALSPDWAEIEKTILEDC